MVIAAVEMRPIGVHVAVIVAVVVVCLTICVQGYQIAFPETDLTNVVLPADTLLRHKRQMETFDDEDLSVAQQQEPEEPGFWDRVVKVALKIFARFVEWLNS